eukprot:5870823-Prymnesium_polylepis.1
MVRALPPPLAGKETREGVLRKGKGGWRPRRGQAGAPRLDGWGRHRSAAAASRPRPDSPTLRMTAPSAGRRSSTQAATR